jgi:protein MBA1
VVSNRAAPLGDDQPNTAYRQVVVRLVSTQSLFRIADASTSSTSTSTTSGSPRKSNRQLPWMPDSARTQSQQSIRKVKDEGEEKVLRSGELFPDNGVPKKVVEYFVMQKRVIGGREEEWKVWGFTHESTPRRIEEDEEYWRRTLDMQAAGGM